jgi:hypothetical protein
LRENGEHDSRVNLFCWCRAPLQSKASDRICRNLKGLILDCLSICRVKSEAGGGVYVLCLPYTACFDGVSRQTMQTKAVTGGARATPALYSWNELQKAPAQSQRSAIKIFYLPLCRTSSQKDRGVNPRVDGVRTKAVCTRLQCRH